MQEALAQMNIQLANVIADVVWANGRAIPDFSEKFSHFRGAS